MMSRECCFSANKVETSFKYLQLRPTMADQPPNPAGNEAAAAPNDAPNDGYTPSTPFVVNVPYEDGSDPVYEPIELPQNERFSAAFVLPEGFKPLPASLSELFLPDSLIDLTVERTNNYLAKCLPPDQVQPVDRTEILRFFAMYYYTGLVKLPAKRDYWKLQSSSLWPFHPITKLMTCTRFEYIWRYIHLAEMGEGDLDLIAEEEAAEASSANDGHDGLEEEEDVRVGDQPLDERWLAKAAPLVDHCNKVAKRACRHPSYTNTVDEQMKRFQVRSSQSHQMKQKPIKQGYKFFSICCAQTGYIFHFLPDGRGEIDGSLGDTVVELMETLPQRNNLQYVIGMDNLITTRQVMTESRRLGIGVVGTARFQCGWLPKEITQVTDERFNSLYLQKDENNYLIARWIDNNIVTMVTTVHTGTKTVLLPRRRPRQTETNKNLLQRLWGRQPVVKVYIPRIIDDYNHWMLGCDKSDQLMAYYRPNIRCRRTWTPIMLHCLDVLRVNAFLVCKHAGPDSVILHKFFIEQWIEALLDRATLGSTRRTCQSSHSPAAESTAKRRRVSTKKPTLPPRRLIGDQSIHLEVIQPDRKQRTCAYCSHLHAVAKKDEEEELPKVRRVYRKCSTCEVYLCGDHFGVYHGWNNS